MLQKGQQRQGIDDTLKKKFPNLFVDLYPVMKEQFNSGDPSPTTRRSNNDETINLWNDGTTLDLIRVSPTTEPEQEQILPRNDFTDSTTTVMNSCTDSTTAALITGTAAVIDTTDRARRDEQPSMETLTRQRLQLEVEIKKTELLRAKDKHMVDNFDFYERLIGTKRSPDWIARKFPCCFPFLEEEDFEAEKWAKYQKAYEQYRNHFTT